MDQIQQDSEDQLQQQVDELATTYFLHIWLIEGRNRYNNGFIDEPPGRRMLRIAIYRVKIVSQEYRVPTKFTLETKRGPKRGVLGVSH